MKKKILKGFLQRILQDLMKRKPGTSDIWLTSPSSKWPSKPAYHIVD